MHLYIHLFGLTLPSYGLMITLGVVLANIVAIFYVLKHFQLDFNDFMILEGYTMLGGFLGAKGLYLIVSYKEIDWSRMLDIDYFNAMMQGGFVFYGGLIFGILFALLAGKIHKIDCTAYIKHGVFLIPFIHSFGRIGCFLAGCCYGIPYDGFLSVRFPENTAAPSGIPLFPVQLVEAVFLMVIAISMIIFDRKRPAFHSLAFYLLTYGILRFVLEYFRYDAARGEFLLFSTSQWISLGMILVALILFHTKIRQTSNVPIK